MYDREDLLKYDYFKDKDYNYLHDSLTGVISRPHIIGFAKNLVENNIPFTICFVDLDNFKDINDNYGHKVGDDILKEFAKNLQNYTGDLGIVGRYGGDEFLVIHFNGVDYESSYNFIFQIYCKGGILRHHYNIDGNDIYITATIGSASFPNDSDNFDDLFLKVDKALYRGKTKGRNCFIIYIEEKHGNINVYEKDFEHLSTLFKRINKINIDYNYEKPEKRIKRILDYTSNSIGMSQISFIKIDGTVISSGNHKPHILDESCIELLKEFCKTDEVYYPVSMDLLKKQNKKAAKFAEERNLLTFTCSKVSYYNDIYGFVMMLETSIERIWQDKELSLSMFLDKVFMMLSQEENGIIK